MARLPIRPIIVVDANPKEVEKNQILRISARIFDKKSLSLMKVSRIYMSITSTTDGHVVWPLEVIRKNTSGFDIGIGTQEMKEGHEYIVRVSNNWNLSPSGSVTFKIKETQFPLALLLPLALSPLFVRKYQDLGIRDTDGLVEYLKSQGFSDQKIQQELKRILDEVETQEEIRIPIDLERRVVSKKWITQMDHRVCSKCQEHANKVWEWDDPDSPDIPEHPNCRCTYELQYANDRTDEFRSAAQIALFANDMEEIYQVVEPVLSVENFNSKKKQ